MFKRKHLPVELEAPFTAFRAVLDELEPAKAALTEVMPTTRLPGRPLPDALLEFEGGLERVQPLMPPWRVTQVEAEWMACAAGLDEAGARARSFREQAPELGGFEGLIWAVEQLLAPLECFASADERFRELGAR